jgi:hypothetical protein
VTAEEIDALAKAIVAHLAWPTKAEILDAITDGMPTGITDAIVKAVSDCMPYPSEIVGAFYQGAREASRK